ncbi:MAG: SOS response-associated peptidase [Planctomycetota bacterium]|nr:SOS response-associated peptidase [Planctomycetota bacterium]
MCGRYTLKSRADVVAGVFGVPVPPTLPERFNIAPAQQVLAIREQPGSHKRELVAFKWGLIPFWADDPEISIRTINARSETAATKPAFRASFRSRRCLIVADGFYEWQARDGKKQPYYIRLKSGEPFGMGGLWDRWDKQGDARETCTILTCDANEPMRVIHDRMPVVIPPESFEIWLDPAVNDADRLSRLLRPFHSDEMTAYPVSTLVNNVKNDSPKLVDSLPPPEKQARLFSLD